MFIMILSKKKNQAFYINVVRNLNLPNKGLRRGALFFGIKSLLFSLNTFGVDIFL